MARKSRRTLIVGLDIGTSKVACIVGEVTKEGQVEVLGVGTYPSRGLKKGVVVNLETTVQSIQRAVEEAELRTHRRVESVYVGIAGSHIGSMNSHGIVAVKDKEVGQTDVDRVIESARSVSIPSDQKILHILPQEFVIDRQEGIKEPVGMSGIRLEARVHIVTGSVSAAQNIVKCVRRCALDVEDIVLEQLASCASVLTDDERELGVCLVDIGGGTTDLAVFTNGAIRHTAVIPIAGDQITNDIAVALRTPIPCAEAIKLEHACALVRSAQAEEMLEVPSLGERPSREISQTQLAEIVEPRCEELLLLVREELRRSGFEELIAAGVVLTGGSARVKGLTELAEEIFRVPVRIGIPQYVTGLNEVTSHPSYATGIGLLLFGKQQTHNKCPATSESGFSGWWMRLKRWFMGTF